MNVDHREKVQKVLAMTQVAVDEIMKKMGGRRDAHGNWGPADIADAAIREISALSRDFWRSAFEGVTEPLDLIGADLADGWFYGLQTGSRNPFTGVNLEGANLSNTRWFSFSLEEANLTGADLSGAFMLGLCCEGATFRDANLQGASVHMVTGEPIDLSGVDFTGGSLLLDWPPPPVLTGANLNGVTVRGGPQGGPAFDEAVKALVAGLTEQQQVQITIEAPQPDAPEPAPRESNGGGGCFIATAACGSPMVPEVRVLRTFRDERLSTSAAGRGLVRSYYLVSPPFARWLTTHPRAQLLVREWLVRPLARWLEHRRV